MTGLGRPPRGLEVGTLATTWPRRRPVRVDLADQIEPGWTTRAACAVSSLDPDAWFTDPGIPTHLAARAVCAGCPVRRSCLAWALATTEPEGLWGGADHLERRTLRAALAGGIPVSVVLGWDPVRRAAA